MSRSSSGSVERVLLAAAVADRVMVVLAARVGGLEAGGAADVDPVHQPELGERVERAVDAREADARGRRRAGGRGSPGRSGSRTGGRAGRAPRRAAPPARWPARASSCRAWSVQVRHAQLHGNENRFQYGDPRCAPSSFLFAAACAVLLAACGSGGGSGRPARRSWRRRRRPPISRAPWPAIARGSAGVLAPNSDPHDYEVRARRRQGAGPRAPRRALRRRPRRVARRRDRQRGRRRPGARPARRRRGRGRRPALVAGPAARRARGRRRSGPRSRRPIPARRRRLRRQRAPLRCGGCARSTPPSRDCIGQIPAGERTLVTTHDALGYYARRYGLRVVGTVIPSLSTQGQASAGRPREARRHDPARAACGRSSPRARSTPSVEDAIAQETGARVGRAAVGGLARPGRLERRDLRGLDPRQHLGDRRGPDGRGEDVLVPALILDAPYVQRAIAELAAARACSPACSAPGSCCAATPSTRTPSGTATFPGLVVAAPLGVAPQLTALAAALGFGAGHRAPLARRAGWTRTPRPGCCSSPRSPPAACSPRTSTSPARASTSCCSAR